MDCTGCDEPGGFIAGQGVEEGQTYEGVLRYGNRLREGGKFPKPASRREWNELMEYLRDQIVEISTKVRGTHSDLFQAVEEMDRLHQKLERSMITR